MSVKLSASVSTRQDKSFSSVSVRSVRRPSRRGKRRRKSCKQSRQRSARKESAKRRKSVLRLKLKERHKRRQRLKLRLLPHLTIKTPLKSKPMMLRRLLNQPNLLLKKESKNPLRSNSLKKSKLPKQMKQLKKLLEPQHRAVTNVELNLIVTKNAAPTSVRRPVGEVALDVVPRMSLVSIARRRLLLPRMSMNKLEVVKKIKRRVLLRLMPSLTKFLRLQRARLTLTRMMLVSKAQLRNRRHKLLLQARTPLTLARLVCSSPLSLCSRCPICQTWLPWASPWVCRCQACQVSQISRPKT